MSDEHDITISAVVPVFCEGKPLAHALEMIRSQIAACGERFELIVIDDGSTDDTWRVIEHTIATIPELVAHRLSRNFGKEAAVAAGLSSARGEVTYVLDADLQHPPELIPEMYDIWRHNDVQIVEAVKDSRGNESVISKLGSRMFYSGFKKLVGFDLHGATDFKLIDRNVRNAWLQLGERNLFFRGMVAWLGFAREQVTFIVPERHAGSTKWSPMSLARLAVSSISAFSSAPLLFVIFAGAVFFVIALVIGALVIYYKVTGVAETGFTTVICLQLITGSFIMFSLGGIGIYIAQIYREVKHRPRYIIRTSLSSNEVEPKL